MAKSQIEKEVYKDVEDKYQTSRDDVQKRHQDFKKYEDLYLGFLRSDENPWKSEVAESVAFEVVERMTSHLFASKPRGRVMPRESSDVAGGKIHEELFKYQWTKPGQSMHRKTKRLGTQAGQYGTGFGLLTWRYERRKKKSSEYDDEGNLKRSEKYYTKWDDPFFQDLFIYDCFPDPSATDIDDMEWFIHNEYTTLDKLEAENHKRKGSKMKRYKNLGTLRKMVMNKKRADATVDTTYKSRQEEQKGDDTTTRKGRILVRRYYDRDKWISICPDFNLVIEDRPNPYDHCELPIHVIIDHDYPNQLFGRGEIEPVESKLNALNSVVNQRMDNVRLILSPPVIVDAESEYSHEWVFAPGWKWRVGKNEKQPEVFQFPDVTGNTYLQTSNDMKDGVRQALGYQDFITRNESGADKTAAEVRSAAGEQNVRMRGKEHNVDDFMARMVTQWVQLNQQFTTKEKMIRVVGKDAMEVLEKITKYEDEYEDPDTGEMQSEAMRSKAVYKGDEYDKFEKSIDGSFGQLIVEPEDLKGTYDFVVESGSTVEVDQSQELANIKQALEAAQSVEQNLQAEGYKINYKLILEDLYSKLGIKNVDQLIEQIEEEPMMNEQQGQEQMMMGEQPMDPMGQMPPQMAGAGQMPGAGGRFNQIVQMAQQQGGGMLPQPMPMQAPPQPGMVPQVAPAPQPLTF